MRKSVNPVAFWPSNGPAYPPRARSYPDSVHLRTSFKRQFSTQSSGLTRPRTRHDQYIALFSSRPRALRKFDPLLKIGGGTCQFSACTPKRSDEFEGFDEEDEDNIITSSSDLGLVVRHRARILEARARKKREQEQALMRRREELQSRADQYANTLQNAIHLLQKINQNLDSIRRYAQEHERWMKRYEQVITSSASSVTLGSQLFEEFLLIKYPKLGEAQSFINDNVTFIQHGEAEVSRCRQTLRQVGLASRRIDLEMRLAQIESSLASAAERLSHNHITPIASAKRNIENILEPLSRFHSQYVQLQLVGEKIKKSSRDISSDLKELAVRHTKRKSRLETYAKNILTGYFNITQSLHEYRTMRRGLRWGGPLGKTHIITLLQNYFNYQTIQTLASDMGMNADLLANEVETHGMSSLMAHWYLHRWKEGDPRSVDSDIAWRHFDIYYPFYMLYTSLRSLGSEVFRFQKAWGRTGTSRSEARFAEWKIEFDVQRSIFLMGLEESSYYTWLRLETEDKVSRLGGVADTIAKGLFTPKDPPSSDIRRFILCIDAICDSLSRSMNLDQAAVDFDKLSHPTVLDAIMLLDHSPSHKPRIRRSRPLTPKKATKQEQPPASKKAATQKQPLALGKKSKQQANAIETPIQVHYVLSQSSMPPGRGYCTDSRVFMDRNGHQCGVSEPEIALNKQERIVDLTNKDTAICLVSDTVHTGIMSSHESPDNSDEPPVIPTDEIKPQFWSYDQYKTPDGGKIGIHYCKNLEHAERAAALFSGSKLLGFDIEWKPQAQISAGIKSNVSLIQIANEERIALFHIALFKGNEIHDLVPPSLKRLLESTDTVKVGVSIKADCSRVRRHLDIDTKGQFELSHLYKLVKYGSTQPKLVDRRAVNLAQQVEELLGLPLRKDSEVRKSDWTKPLDYAQVQCEFPLHPFWFISQD